MPGHPVGRRDGQRSRAKRLRLAECIAKMAVAIANGECTPAIVELEALAQICDEQGLPQEAARVRQWISWMTS